MSKKAARSQRSALTDLAPTGLSETERIIQQSLARQQELQSDGRGQPAHAGEVGVDKRGQQKATYYIPAARQALVREIAQAEEVSQADIVELAIVALHHAWRAGKVDVTGLKKPTKSLRVLWKLDVPDELDLFT